MKTGPSDRVAISMAFFSFGEYLCIFFLDNGLSEFLDGLIVVLISYDWFRPSSPIWEVTSLEIPG